DYYCSSYAVGNTFF
nr:immunoglobulin light chain junction region [Macaca mulatta]